MFRIGRSPIHGLGWFATCDIPADTPLLDEEVCIRLPLDMSKMTDLGGPELHDELLSNLSDDERNSLLALDGNSLLDKLWMNGSPLVNFDTDPLGIGARKELGIYLKSARLNHSCIPNAVRASDKGNVMSVVSQKDIVCGEEITISYMDDNLAVSDDREKQMQSKLHSYREELLRGTLSKEGMATGFLPLMEAEGLPMSLMGQQAILKLMTCLHGIDMSRATCEELDSFSFRKGARVTLHKLKAKPDLNGKVGSVVYPLNEETGRVGILLDDEEKPLAVKPENLCLVRKDIAQS